MALWPAAQKNWAESVSPWIPGRGLLELGMICADHSCKLGLTRFTVAVTGRSARESQSPFLP